jgi:hypothetical protein
MATAASSKKFQNPLLLLLHVDIALLLFINGIVYSVFYGVTASISTVFHDAYPQLNETELGLCFLSAWAFRHLILQADAIFLQLWAAGWPSGLCSAARCSIGIIKRSGRDY